jgi:putative DNA primase/helicase
MTAPNFDAIPEGLKALNQWVLWKTITRAGRLTKVPYDTKGHEGDSSDPTRWENYFQVVDAYNNNRGKFDGIGFTFDVLDTYAGIDLDDCINEDGCIRPRAKAILDKLDSYSEISPSARGCKIFLKAKNPVASAGKMANINRDSRARSPI